MKITKVVITGYIEHTKEQVMNMDINDIGIHFDRGNGICVDGQLNVIKVQTTKVEERSNKNG